MEEAKHDPKLILPPKNMILIEKPRDTVILATK
jgi:hypothetical protein